MLRMLHLAVQDQKDVPKDQSGCLFDIVQQGHLNSTQANKNIQTPSLVAGNKFFSDAKPVGPRPRPVPALNLLRGSSAR